MSGATSSDLRLFEAGGTVFVDDRESHFLAEVTCAPLAHVHQWSNDTYISSFNCVVGFHCPHLHEKEGFKNDDMWYSEVH